MMTDMERTQYQRKSILAVLKPVTGIVFLVVVDQILKLWAVSMLMGREPVVIIDGVLELRYLENSGAAFGMLQNATVFFIILTLAVIAFAAFVYLRTLLDDKFIFLHLTLILLIGGAIGNFIDRILNTYVVDYIYFKLIDFPIFNFADICVTFAEIFLIIALLFVYKEDDLKGIFKKSE